MSESVKELTSKNFDEFIKKGNTIIDFWAEWCGPCKMLKPVFESSAKDFKDKVHFGKVNIENDGELAERFMVMSIPTIIFFKGGEQVDRFTGVLTKEEIADRVESNF